MSDETTANMQVKEEAVWTITNLSFFSAHFESEFQVAAEAMMEILKVDKIDNLAAILNLKQQCIQALGNLAIDSQMLRTVISGHDGLGLKIIVDLILFNRIGLSEQCFWTINNFLLADREYAIKFIQVGICKALVSTLDRLKSKTQELMTELAWTLNYLLDFDEQCVHQVVIEIPHLVRRLTCELEYEGERLHQSPLNRPIIRVLGNLLTINTLQLEQITSELLSDDKFQTFLLSVLLKKPEQAVTDLLS